ncbi:hypothetical protein ABKA04_004186 [Annulohypoxylon sp. FPYF3050]
MLIEKLGIAKSILGGIVNPSFVYDTSGGELSKVERLRYAKKKENLDNAIDALETWQQISDPSWFLIMKMSNRGIDDALIGEPKIEESIPAVSAIRIGSQKASPTNSNATQLELSDTYLNAITIEDVMFSDVKLANNVDSDRANIYVLDVVGSTAAGLEADTKKATGDLARRLQHNEPLTFALLSCKGFVVEKGISSIFGSPANFTLVFQVPPSLTNPRSLRHDLLGARLDSLSQRFSIARQLARSVTYVHVFGFVHKNIRPENVLEFSGQATEMPSTFLVGFKDFRMVEGRTSKRGDNALEKNLYRHPERQGVVPRNKFRMQHDIYSLGVCLLEIGLWQSFIQYDHQNEKSKISEEFKVLCDVPGENMARFLLLSVKDRLVELARSKLREQMGDQYSRIVETCLTCLDPDNTDFGDPREFGDEDEIRVGVRYIEKVLQRLDSLRV